MTCLSSGPIAPFSDGVEAIVVAIHDGISNSAELI